MGWVTSMSLTPEPFIGGIARRSGFASLQPNHETPSNLNCWPHSVLKNRRTFCVLL